MTAITSYTTLLDALQDWDNRADLVSRYPQFIALAEAHFNRVMRSSEMETTVTQDTTESTIALPSDYLEAREVYIDGSPDTVLIAMDPAGLRGRYGYSNTGDPAAYTITGTNLVLAPAPGSSITAVLTYYAKVPALSSDNETNWLIVSYPDAYLSATRFYALKFIQDPSAASELDLASAIIDSINDAGNRRRTPAGPLTMRPAASA
jgi:hypothetical protein